MTRPAPFHGFHVLVVAVLTLLAAVAAFPQWTGEVEAGYAWESVGGSEESYLSQTGLREGFLLESLTLRYASSDGPGDPFVLKAWGFGNAYPDEHARMTVRLPKSWKLELNYDRRESYFHLAGTDLGLRSDDWRLTRWTGRVIWDGWSAARFTLIFRHVKRDGRTHRYFYGLNELYPMGVNLDETMKEATLRIETKTLPVKLVFEQSLARYDRNNRWLPEGRTDVTGNDPDLLAALSTDRKERQDVPTSRFMAAYAGTRWEVAGSLLYSSSDLDSSGFASRSYDVGGGTIGQIAFEDALSGSANQDTFAGNLRLGFELGSGWVLRLSGDYHDTTANSDLLGQRLVRAGKPGLPGLVLCGPVDERGNFDVTNRLARVELEKSSTRWALWGGFFAGSRDVSWKRTTDDPGADIKRNSDGFFFGGSFKLGERTTLRGEYEHGDFQRYVFRTDPNIVDRFTLRLRSSWENGWFADAHLKIEDASNPTTGAGLDHESTAVGATLGWDSTDGETGVGLQLDNMKLHTATGLILPGDVPGYSQYDTDIWTLALRGHTRWGPVRLHGDILRMEDRGKTWPLNFWDATARATFEAAARTAFTLFLTYRSYDEDRTDLDDFDSTRIGFTVHWRF